MYKEVHPINPQFAANLRLAKANLAVAKQGVEDAEAAIYTAGGDLIPEKGTVHFTGVKVATGFTEKWDDEELAKAETAWPSISNLPFPFRKVYKADGKAVTYLRENAKDAYDLIAKALTITPRKPSFELEDE
jgi:hypothetical protein